MRSFRITYRIEEFYRFKYYLIAFKSRAKDRAKS